MRHLHPFFHSGGRHRHAGRHRDEPGFPGPHAGRFGGRWGGRTRRGEGKFLVLETLAAGPQHGYEIMSAIEAKHGFRPSPGSIYPTLQMLDEGGFVTSAESDGKRVYTITAAGRELLASRSAPDADDDGESDSARRRARHAVGKLMAAIMSARSSDDATLDKIREVADRARREVYAILAADES